METKENAVEIDGSLLEGGGQVLRTSLALSAISGKQVLIKNIRAARPKPGLQPQHLAGVKAIAAICNAVVEGAKPGSAMLSFRPKNVVPSNLIANIGTAGSISLLLSQVLLPSLLQKTALRVVGGTNVPFSPPIEFLQEELFPALKKMGAGFGLSLNRRGYFPKGNGVVSFASKPAKFPLKPIKLAEFGEIAFAKIFSHCSSLPKSVAENQAVSLKNALSCLGIDFEEHIECAENSQSIGSGITVFARTTSGGVLSGSALGAKGIPAEKVGKEAAENLLKELSGRQPCDSHLADQLIPFMALAKGKSEINVSMLSNHCITNIAVVEKFFPVHFSVEGELGNPAKVSVEGIGFQAK